VHYYALRACNGTGCSLPRWGSNGVNVVSSVTPSAPTVLVNPPSSTGSYTVSWSASTPVSIYELQKATEPTFSAPQYWSTTTTSLQQSGVDGTYYYRVRACNGSLCSEWRTSSQPTVVDTTP
jgi:hypothetical protein